MNTASTRGKEPFACTCYRLLLHCYPAAFRREFEREMLLTFRACHAEAVRQDETARLWSVTLTDLLKTVPVEHVKILLSYAKKLFGFEEKKGTMLMTAMTIISAQQTDIGRQRQTNEDAVLSYRPEDNQVIEKQGFLFVVADGVGGHTSGDLASRLAVATIREAYYQDESDDRVQVLRHAIEEANMRIYRENMSAVPQPAPEKMMGSTVVAAAVCGETLYAANVGDSRVYLIRGDEMRQVSLDHSVVGEQVRAGILTKEQARVHPQRNQIYRCLGEKDSVEVDTYTEHVQAGDLILLCTDGLSELVSEEDIAAIVRQNEPQESVRLLVECANAAGGPDNITALVARVA